MERSGFFNALRHENGKYDRTYDANDYCDNLAVIISNGVLRSEEDDLKVASNGMIVSVNTGRAFIKGHWYHNDAVYTFPDVSTPLVGARWDRVVLRLDKNRSVRTISLKYIQGTSAISPTKPEITRTEDIFDLCLADIYVEASATSLTVNDTRANNEVCGWVYSTSGDGSFFTSLDNKFDEWMSGLNDTLSTTTVEIEHKQLTVLTEASNTVEITIPQYNADVNQKVNVYVNGMLEYSPNDYTISGRVITFSSQLVIGTEIAVVITVAKDGSGISSVVDDVTLLQNKVAALESGLIGDTYTYICSGTGDNVKLSQIAQNWLQGGTDYGSLRVNVHGTFGATAAYQGDGTSNSPFRWISVGLAENTNRKIIFDFSGCGEINLPITTGTYNTVFYGHNAHIIGANVIANQTGEDTVVKGFSSSTGAVYAENCRFWFTSYKDSVIANTGTFTNCRASVANVTNNSYCFSPYSDSLVRINGGEYYAYTGSSSAQSAIIGQSGANAASILYGINAPTLARSGFYQTHSIIQFAGGGILNCTDLVSALPLSVTAGISNIRGTIALSKCGLG